MAYGRKSTASSILEVFTLNPLPYPVLIILAVISIFLGLSWFSSYESAVENANDQMGLVFLITPVLLLILARWVSTMEDPLSFFKRDARYRHTRNPPSEGGGSPWFVAAVIVVLLVLVQYQSAFHDSWFG